MWIHHGEHGEHGGREEIEIHRGDAENAEKRVTR
jgi:hypothetical protein